MPKRLLFRFQPKMRLLSLKEAGELNCFCLEMRANRTKKNFSKETTPFAQNYRGSDENSRSEPKMISQLQLVMLVRSSNC